MLLQLLLFFFLLSAILLITKRQVKLIFQVLYLIGGSKHLAVWILAVLLLPGTFIHEISHFILATLLRVPVGNISIIPQITKDNQVLAGHVTLGRSDPFRMSIIGLAPMLIGLTLIYFTGRYFFNYLNLDFLTAEGFLKIFLGLILFFEISTTMFSSKRDLYSLLIILPVIILLAATFYLTGVKVVFEEKTVAYLNEFLKELNFYLLLTAVTDYFLLLVLSSIIYLTQKIFRIKIRIN